MQTIYYKTGNFVHHSDNIVDLESYRRRMALTQEGSLAPQPRPEDCFQDRTWEDGPCGQVWEGQAWEDGPSQPYSSPARPRRGSAKRQRRALLLDMCASVGVLAMTLAFILRVVLG